MVGQPARPTHLSVLVPAPREPRTLPAQPTPILGRTSEIADVQARLRDPGQRLLTLTGPGGTGKTRLALEAAAGLASQFDHRVAFVDLIPVADPTHVLTAIAQALAVRDSGGEDVLGALIASVRETRLLLVLDNFEHVIAAAPAVAHLVAACAGLTVLVTSRAPLRVRWEQEYPVGPLVLPGDDLAGDPAALAANPAVALFVQRARAVRPEFGLTGENAADVAAICTRLQGMPLAIELAAARVRALSARSLLARLEQDAGTPALQLLSSGARDLPERQRSMRETIAWSHALLSPRERTLFRRLAVFAGGWTAEAAEAICAGIEGDDDGAAALPAGAVLDTLSALVEQSMVVEQQAANGETRFSMLETINEFSRELFAVAGEQQEVRRRHAGYLLTFVRQSRRGASGPAAWAQAVEQEYHNLRAALTWSLAAGEGEPALRLCAALTTFWYDRGHYREGRDWCARALTTVGQAPAALRATVLRGAASLADIQHEYDEARSLIDASVALLRDGDRPRDLASSLAMLGMIARHQRDWAAAGAACEEALAIYADAPEPWGERLALGVLGWLAEDQGDRPTARRFLTASLTEARKGGSPVDVALQLNNLGILAVRDGDHAAAEARHREALHLSSEVNALEPLACALEGLAAVACTRSGAGRAAWLLGAATALRTVIGAPRIAQFEEEYVRVAAAVRAALGDDAYAAANAAGAAAPLPEVIASTLIDGDAPDVQPSLIGGAALTPPMRGAEPDLPRAAPLPTGSAALTARQIAYLRLLARGLTNKEIAAALVVSEVAVEQMLVRLYDKLRVRNRAAAIHYALSHGLGDPAKP